MTMLTATVDPWEVEDGQVIRRIPSQPRRDGVVAWHDVDDVTGDEEFHLTDGRTYRCPHGQPVTVILTIDATPDQIRPGDLIAEAGHIVRVIGVARGLGVRVIRWASDQRDGDGIPLITGITAVRPEEMATTRIRLIDRPENLTGVAW